MLSPETPYPLHGGGALRTASLLNYLSRHFDVDLITFRQRPEQDPAAAVPAGLVQSVQVIDLPQHSRNSLARAWRNASRLVRGRPPLVDRFSGFTSAFASKTKYEVAVIEHFWCAEYYEVLAKVAKRVVLNLHNVESAWHRTCAAAEPFLRAQAHRRFERNCLGLERTWLPKFDAVLTASDHDADRIREVIPHLKLFSYPNAIPLVPVPEREEEAVIAFSGNMEYQPNRSAVQFFARTVWPELSRMNPDLRWRLIGMNPHCIEGYVRGLSRVELTGPIPDAVAELRSARIVVAPLLSGSGTRLKIIEAWAAARPVVSTTIGSEGLPVVANRNIYIADSPHHFVESIQSLLNSPDERDKVGRAGRYLYEQEFSWEAAWRKLDCSKVLLGG
jgi:polysaccharide biosynthesis protein PslH